MGKSWKNLRTQIGTLLGKSCGGQRSHLHLDLYRQDYSDPSHSSFPLLLVNNPAEINLGMGKADWKEAEKKVPEK